MFRIQASAAFDSAHFLAGYSGKCSRLHGHHWVVEAEAAQDTLMETGQERGMVLDFHTFKGAVRALADAYDHALLYEEGSLRAETVEALEAEHFRLIALPFRPTAELLAQFFLNALRESGLPVVRVAVWETPENCAVCEA